MTAILQPTSLGQLRMTSLQSGSKAGVPFVPVPPSGIGKDGVLSIPPGFRVVRSAGGKIQLSAAGNILIREAA